MPLVSGGGKKGFAANMRELSGPSAQPRPLKQRLAIAFAQLRKGKKKGTST